jgi:hypothetical protein
MSLSPTRSWRAQAFFKRAPYALPSLWESPFPSLTAWLKARIDLGWVLLIFSESSLPEPRNVYLTNASHSCNTGKDGSDSFPLLHVRSSQDPSHSDVFLEGCDHRLSHYSIMNSIPSLRNSQNITNCHLQFLESENNSVLQTSILN